MIMETPGPGTVLVEGRSAVSGVGHGRLVGGNLSLIAADVGVEPPPEVSAIAVFEDIGEDGYRIDRMLTQLLRSRWFDQVTGVVVGEFSPVAGASPSSSGLAAAVITDRLAPAPDPGAHRASPSVTAPATWPCRWAPPSRWRPARPGTPGTLTLA